MNKKPIITIVLVVSLILIVIIGTVVILGSVFTADTNTEQQAEQTYGEHEYEEIPTTPITEAPTVPVTEWGFYNTDLWGGVLAGITPTVSGKYILSDDGGDYVLIMKDNNIFWEFYPYQNQIVTNSLNSDFTLESSDVINYSLLSNDKISVVEPWESYTISIVDRFTDKNVPVFKINDGGSGYDYFIPFEHIDTSRPFDFYQEGETYGSKSYHYYKFYLK